MSNQPVCTMRDGRIKVVVWQNNGNGNSKKPFYSATMTKSYQDDNGEWQEPNSLTGNEMVRASALLTRAYNRYKYRKYKRYISLSPALTDEPQWICLTALFRRISPARTLFCGFSPNTL